MTTSKYTKKDFANEQLIRWCPGCGDYAILAAMQRALPEMNVDREDVVFISGIGCSSRLTYYMNTYGFHTIHGRAPTIATGVKLSNPKLSVWVVTGDGDAFSIGGNHILHLLRRNVNLNVLVINNQIYGLTKGQFSPTSEKGKVTKSSPYGSIEESVNPLDFLLSSKASFVGRTIDKDIMGMQKMFIEAEKHQGTSVVEIYQNCNIFNNNTFEGYTLKEVKDDNVLNLVEDTPLLYGKEKDRALYLDENLEVQSISLPEAKKENITLLTHRAKENSKLFSKIYPIISERADLPTPFGIFRKEERAIFEDQFNRELITKDEDFYSIMSGNHSWEVK